jgi:methyl-accepting chemotaxis protein
MALAFASPSSSRGFHGLSTTSKLFFCFLASGFMVLLVGGVGIWGSVRAASSADNGQIIWILGILLAITFVGIMSVGYWITRQITTPMQALAEIADRVADGDIPLADDLVRLYGGNDGSGRLVLAFKKTLTIYAKRS